MCKAKKSITGIFFLIEFTERILRIHPQLIVLFTFTKFALSDFPTLGGLVVQAWLCASKLRDMEDLLTSYLCCASQPCPACRCVCVSWLCNMHLVRSGFLWKGALVRGWSESRDADISPPGYSEKPDCHSAAKLTCTACQEEPGIFWVQGLHFQISTPIHSFSADLLQKIHPQASSEKLTLTFWLKNDVSISISGHCTRQLYLRKPFHTDSEYVAGLSMWLRKVGI